jgi:hypothetical protein
LPTLSSILTGLYKEGCLVSFTGLGMDITRACFHAGGKYCLRRTALNSSLLGYRALWLMSHNSVRNTVRAPSLPSLESLYGQYVLRGAGYFSSLAGAQPYTSIA